MNNLKTLRLNRGMTRPELSRASGVTERSICAWETGDRDLEIAAYRSVVALATALKVAPSELFTVSNAEQEVT